MEEEFNTLLRNEIKSKRKWLHKRENFIFVLIFLFIFLFLYQLFELANQYGQTQNTGCTSLNSTNSKNENIAHGTDSEPSLKQISKLIESSKINQDRLVSKIKHELHNQEVWKTLFQLPLVILITISFFQYFLIYSCQTWNKERCKVSILLGAFTLWFIYLMHSEYQPAVFVMALVAIFVAAEHYGELESTEAKLSKAANDIQQIINADGIRRWKKDLYNGWYDSTDRIEGIIKIFDIDYQWWEDKKNIKGDYGARWKNYSTLPIKSDDKTFYQALIHHDPKKKDIYDELKKRGIPEVLFVADVPMPNTAKWKKTWGDKTDKFKANQFSTFLGLSWQLLVVSKIREKRSTIYGGVDNKSEIVPIVRVVVSAPPNWMHVYKKDHLLEVIVANDAENINHPDHEKTYARLLTDRLDENSEQRIRLVNWARQDIRWHAARGGEAEEYLMSLIRYLMLGIIADNQVLDDQEIERIVDTNEWFDSWCKIAKPHIKDENEKARIKRICTDIFLEFIRNRLMNDISPGNNLVELTLSNFDYELI